MSRGRGVLFTSLLLICALLWACSGDDKDKPEIIDSGGGSSEDTPGRAVAPPDVVGAGGGGTGLTTVPGLTTGALPGLTVRSTKSATVAADQAAVVAFLSIQPSGPTPIFLIPERDKSAIVAAVTALGVRPEDVSFETPSTGGPFTPVAVKVGLNEVQTRGKQILDAITAVRGAQSTGVRFSLSNCSAALAPLRKQAFDAAAEDAKAFASTVSLTLGPVIALSDAPLQPQYGPYGIASGNACEPENTPAKIPTGISPLDSKAEVKLSVSLSVTYSLGGGAPQSSVPELGASGTGKATAKADEAYVLIAAYLQGGGPFGPPTLSERDRRDLLDEIEGLDIDEEDIEITSPQQGGPVIIYVEVDMKKLPDIGRDIADAVQQIIGTAEQQGVRFTHTNCEAVLQEARKQAIADAKRSAEALASAAGVKLGELRAINEGGGVITPYGPSLNTCSDDIAEVFALGGPVGTGVVPFDSPAEFTVNTAVSVSYAVSP